MKSIPVRSSRMIDALPNELSLHILHQLVWPSASTPRLYIDEEEKRWAIDVLPSLYVLSAVNSAFHAAVEPLLYRSFSGGSDTRARRFFMRTISDRPELVNHVRHLSWCNHNARWGPSYPAWESGQVELLPWQKLLYRLPLQSQFRNQVYEASFTRDDRWEFMALFIALPRLESYHAVDDGSKSTLQWFMMIPFQSGVNSDFSWSDRLSRLREVHMHGLSRATLQNGELPQLIFSHVHTLTLGHFVGCHMPLNAVPSSTVKELRLLDGTFSATEYAHLLRCFSRLETIRHIINIPRPHTHGHRLYLHDWCLALRLHRHTLKSFQFICPLHVWYCCNGQTPGTPIRSFKDFPKLEHLEIFDVAFMSELDEAFDDETCCQSLADFLPPSIKHVSLTALQAPNHFAINLLADVLNRKAEFVHLNSVTLRCQKPEDNFSDGHLNHVRGMSKIAGLRFEVEQVKPFEVSDCCRNELGEIVTPG